MALSLPLQAMGEEIKRVRLDQMTIDYMGMDLNADSVPDFIRMNILTEKHSVFLGSDRGRPEKLDPTYLSEEEERFFPDLVKEVDLDGNNIDELILVNSRVLMTVWKDEKALHRFLGDAVFIGLQNGELLSLGSSKLPDEAREELLENAKQVLLREPALTGL
jgi:hypothetical protein